MSRSTLRRGASFAREGRAGLLLRPFPVRENDCFDITFFSGRLITFRPDTAFRLFSYSLFAYLGGEELPFPRPVIRSWGCMRAWEGEEDAREAGSAWKCVHERDTSCERRLWYDANIRIKGDTYIRAHTSKRIDIHTHTCVRLCVCVLVTLVILPRQYTHVRFEIHYPKYLYLECMKSVHI